jgi:hypothetical protein
MALELISSRAVMSLLSQHTIRGAAHDSSARAPPPRCHPHTRVKLIARITAGFDNQELQELLLWITGPAGVGKSAVVQTFAEYLVKCESLGASVFISRPNGRNNPHGIFITIGYQLATRIEAYRNFIVERLSFDPELLSGNMQAQFAVFIVEPFVKQKIGAGGKRWGILLDGLDELKGEHAQTEIINLISSFANEHRDAPLLWIIASRPESHISNAFDDDNVRRSCWREYIPTDSTEACDDVERFLRSGFKATHKKFRHSVPRDWPSDTDFLKLTAAASGLFVYAEVVMQFIGDSDYADPISRFDTLISVIDRPNTVSIKDNPFVNLDALYNEILSSIPSTLWPTAKQLLGLRTHGERIPRENSYILFSFPQTFQTLRGMSIYLGVPQHVIYACLNKCRSTLKIPDWKVAHKETLTFFHASFADYLKDPSRSGGFHVGTIEDVENTLLSSLLEIWHKCSGDDVAIGVYILLVFVANIDVVFVSASVESAWHQYCSKWDNGAPPRPVAKFHAKLFQDVVYFLGVVSLLLDEPAESPLHAPFLKVHMINLCYYLDASSLFGFLNTLMVNHSQVLLLRFGVSVFS